MIVRALTVRLIVLASIPALVWAADHYEYHDLGILRPGEPTSARVSPPGTVVSGRNVSSSLIVWAGGPQQFTGTVSLTGAGAHEGFFHGTYTKGGAGRGSGPGRVLEWDMKTAAKIADITLTSETEYTAPGNADNTRTTVGVCEDVVITSNVTMDAWYCLRGSLSSNTAGKSVTWTAPEFADSVSVFAYKDGYARSIRFTVLSPTLFYASKINHNELIPADRIGTQMQCEVILRPTTVSFANLFWLEEGGAAANATSATGVFGYIAQQSGIPWIYSHHSKCFIQFPVRNIFHFQTGFGNCFWNSQ